MNIALISDTENFGLSLSKLRANSINIYQLDNKNYEIVIIYNVSVTKEVQEKLQNFSGRIIVLYVSY